MNTKIYISALLTLISFVIHGMDNSLSKALVDAVKNEHIFEVHDLLERGAPANSTCVAHIPALHHAVYRGNYAIVKDLQRHGVDINCTHLEKRNAVHWISNAGALMEHSASCDKYKKIIYFLVKHKINLEAQDKYGKTPLHLASELNNLCVVNELIPHVNINNCDNKKNTALHYAASGGHVDIIKVLLNNGADPDLRSIYNMTPYQVAFSGCYQEAAELIKYHLKSRLLKKQPTLLRTVIRFFYKKCNCDEIKTAKTIAAQINDTKALKALSTNNQEAHKNARAYLLDYLKD